MLIAALVACTAGPAAPAAAPHPNSLSFTELVVGRDGLRASLRVQMASLLEVIDGLDADGDGAVTAEELAASGERVLAYAGEHYRLRTGTRRDRTGGTPIPPRPRALELLPPDPMSPPLYRDWALLELDFPWAEPVEDLVIEVDLFWRTSPDHIDRTELVWDDGSTEAFLIDLSRPRARADRVGRGAFVHWARAGLVALATSWERWALAIGLVLTARTRRARALALGFYALGHGAGLVVAATGLVELPGTERYLVPAGALAVGYVGADALFGRGRPLESTLQGALFGVLHGAIAASLATGLAAEAARGAGLAGAGIGVALGLLPVLAVGALRRDDPSGRRAPALRAAAAALLVAGVAGFAGRLA